MSKYTFVLYHKRQKEFLEMLQEMGLVDITSTDWEANEQERQMVLSIEKHRSAEQYFKELGKTEGFEPGEPYAAGEEAFNEYLTATAEIESLKARLEKVTREVTELKVWGNFSPYAIDKLAATGITIRFFTAYVRDFDELQKTYGEQTVIEKISEHEGRIYFVAVLSPGEEIPFDAQELKKPDMTATGKENEARELIEELEGWERVIARAYASRDKIAAHADQIKEKLDLSRAVNSGERAAEDTLVIMEGWSTAETSTQIDKAVDEYPDIIYIKEKPTPEDDAPVLLKNKKWSNPFEIIGRLYALPHYGTLDLTSFFAPFYMLFFGFCLGDAGYGLVLFLAGLLMRFKSKGAGMKQVAQLTMMCGGSAVLFGFLVGSFFGIALGGLPLFASLKDKFLTTDSLFSLALVLGIVQIIYALVLKIINTTIQFGFKYSLGTLGWLIVLISSICAFLLPDMGINFSFNSPAYFVCAGIGIVLMLFFHNPKKNPLMNFGPGLWNTYNDLTGLLGDVLSYIRLFALCLSGGTLALVFNDLAIGFSADLPIVAKQVVMILILLFGHSINLFMSALGAIVHPMRLTFVEFYKNAGFEATQREFTPLRKIKPGEEKPFKI